MQTFELGKFIQAIVRKYHERAAEKGIKLNLADDLASQVVIAGNRDKMEHLMDMVLKIPLRTRTPAPSTYRCGSLFAPRTRYCLNSC